METDVSFELSVPLFRDQHPLSEAQLYQLAAFSLGLHRLEAAAAGIEGFIAPPAAWRENAGRTLGWNGFVLQPGRKTVEIRPLFLIHMGLPFVRVGTRPEIVGLDGDVLYAKLFLALESRSWSPATPDRYRVAFDWSGQPSGEGFVAAVAVARRTSTSTGDELVALCPPASAHATPELASAHSALTSAAGHFLRYLERTGTPPASDAAIDRLSRLMETPADAAMALLLTEARSAFRSVLSVAFSGQSRAVLHQFANPVFSRLALSSDQEKPRLPTTSDVLSGLRQMTDLLREGGTLWQKMLPGLTPDEHVQEGRRQTLRFPLAASGVAAQARIVLTIDSMDEFDRAGIAFTDGSMPEEVSNPATIGETRAANVWRLETTGPYLFVQTPLGAQVVVTREAIN